MGNSSSKQDHDTVKSPVNGAEKKPLDDIWYSGLPPFMRTPCARSLEGLDIGLVGVPLDAGVSNRSGARHGPREIRNQSSNRRSIHPATRINPYDLCAVAEVGDVAFDHVYDLERARGEIEAFFSCLHAAGVKPLSAGETIPLPTRSSKPWSPMVPSV